MFASKLLIPAVIVLGFAVGAPALAAEPHTHDHAGTAINLQLDHGKKWKTDDAAQHGMSEIRAAMADSIPGIHGKTFTPAQYDALAARIQEQIDYLIANCKLPEDADQQFHLVLEPIIHGIAELKGAPDRHDGAKKVVGALAQYGEYFDHPGWLPLTH